MTRLLVVFPLLLALAGCGDTWEKFKTPDFSWSRDRVLSADRTAGPGDQRAAGCYRGRLTEEGNTCQAMRTDDGGLLTLAGPLRGFASGDSVCVCGVAAARPFCEQGVTLLVRDISDSCANVQ